MVYGIGSSVKMNHHLNVLADKAGNMNIAIPILDQKLMVSNSNELNGAPSAYHTPFQQVTYNGVGQAPGLHQGGYYHNNQHLHQHSMTQPHHHQGVLGQVHDAQNRNCRTDVSPNFH